jgi:hypothetical protein
MLIHSVEYFNSCVTGLYTVASMVNKSRKLGWGGHVVWARQEMHTEQGCGNLFEGSHLEAQVGDGRLTLRWILGSTLAVLLAWRGTALSGLC